MEYTIRTTRTTTETLYTTLWASSEEEAMNAFKTGKGSTGEREYRVKDKTTSINKENAEFVNKEEGMSSAEFEKLEKENKLHEMIKTVYEENDFLDDLTDDVEKELIKLIKVKFDIDLAFCEYHGLWYKDEMLLDNERWYSPDHIRECEKCGKKISVDQYEFEEGRCEDCAF